MPRYVMPDPGSAQRHQAVADLHSALEAAECGALLLAWSSGPVEATAIGEAIAGSLAQARAAVRRARNATGERAGRREIGPT